MAIVQPGNQAYFKVMQLGYKLLDHQGDLMESVAVIRVEGDDLTIKEVSGSRGGNHLTGLKAGKEKEVKRADLPQIAEGKLIILRSSFQAGGSWTIVDEDLQPRKIAGQEVTEAY